MKLTEIASGWFNFIQASPEHQQMINYRLALCDKCEHKKQLSSIGKSILQAVNDKASIFYCGSCHCPLASKTAAPEAACPLNKWSNWVTPQTYY